MSEQQSEAQGYVNRYRGKESRIWSGRTIFRTVQEAQSCPCANADAYVDTCMLVPIAPPTENQP